MENLEFYDPFVSRKSPKLKFDIGKHVFDRPFEYVNVDMWGSVRYLFMVEGFISSLSYTIIRSGYESIF